MITKTVQEIGNGGHIYLPKEMVGQKVLINIIEKTKDEIKREIVEFLMPYLEHIKGIYLYGSYARNEQDAESDIDILVITDGKISLAKSINNYEITSGSEEQIESTIKNNSVMILPILKEAEPILNGNLLEKFKKETITKKNIKWYLETTETSLSLAKEWIKDEDIKSMQYIVYPLIMRLKGLFLIKCLDQDKKYSNKAFLEFLRQKGLKAKEIYKMYRENRDNKNISRHSLTYNDINRLYKVVHQYLQEVKLLQEKLK